MTFRPKQKTPKTAAFAAICAAFAVMFFYTSTKISEYRIFYQLPALVLAVAALQIFIKYMAHDYLYLADETDLKIYKISGNKSICVCSLNYEESISGIIDNNFYKDNKNKFPKTNLAFNYCKNLFPDKYCLYFFNFNNKTAVLKFEPDKAFTDYINEKITAVRSLLDKKESKNTDTQKEEPENE